MTFTGDSLIALAYSFACELDPEFRLDVLVPATPASPSDGARPASPSLSRRRQVQTGVSFLHPSDHSRSMASYHQMSRRSTPVDDEAVVAKEEASLIDALNESSKA